MRYIFLLLYFFLAHYCISQEEKGDYPFTSEILLTDSLLSKYDIKQVNIMRNEIFARNGYVFSTEPYISHFEKKKWYKPASKTIALTEIEKKNITIIKTYEEKIKPVLKINDCIIKTGWSASEELPLRLWELNLDKKQISSLKEIIELLSEEELEMIGTISINDNVLKNLDGIEKFPNLENLYASRNYLMEIKGLSELPNLKDVRLSSNYIREIENLPDTLNILHLSKNKITVLDKIPIINNTFLIDDNPLRKVTIDLGKSGNKSAIIGKLGIYN